MKDKRFSVRLSDKQYDRLEYWSEKEEISKNRFVSEAIDHYIGFLNRDLDMPNSIIQRLNQLIDLTAMQNSNYQNLEKFIQDGFDVILGIQRGANYLMDDSQDVLHPL